MVDTAAKLLSEARELIVQGGYNGFSYADLSARLGIRKASIHHHFPSKAGLVVAVVEQARSAIRAQIGLVQNENSIAWDQLLAYIGYWERCIKEQTAPFCLAAVLAAELPNLPEEVATSVRGHFVDLSTWLERVLSLGVSQGSIRLQDTPAIEAQTFIATVYGAMLAARAWDDPDRFTAIVDSFTNRIRVRRQ
ncbi:TetR/AcrR family transcriptional regulator [Bradyrhizobium sp. BRP22]|uniref:TetR/AcrR family transcriptional regulator n=1 Tax=Bradyrhizobium sp. BRP22 TaxID=2793821 RepID=UPI00201CA595|nr:TetR/AcrR family transcriptional regulator [Bradyrhizobium sp. BRP22]